MTSDELKLAAEYNRGYQDGKKAKSADEWRLDYERSKMVQKLEKLVLDGDPHANLSAICGCIFTSEFGWTQVACTCLRDELVHLLSGNADKHAFVGYDVLGNERHKAVCRLAESKPLLGMTKTEILGDLGKAITNVPDFDPSEIGHIDLMWNTLIHLLGGENGTCPNTNGTCPNDVPSASITSELREWMRIVLTDDDPAYAIADHIDAQFDRICEQQERVLQETIDHTTDAHRELAIELAKTKELLEISYAKRRAYKLHIDQMKGGSKKWRKLYEDAQTLAEVNEQECTELLDLLRDAAEDYRKLKAKYDMHEGVLDATLASLKNSVELPKDRDGVTWNFGDRFTHKGKTYEVSAMRLFETGKWGLETSTYDGNFNPTAFTHAHTAESIVRDLALGLITEKEAVKRIEGLRNE